MEKVDLKHLARLSRIHFEDKDLKVFESQIADILKFVEQLKAVNVDGIEPTSHPLALSNVFREDVPKPGLAIEPFLKTAPGAYKRFFEVPKIIEDKS